MFKTILSRSSALRSRGVQSLRALSSEAAEVQPVHLPISLYGEQATYANALYKTAVRQNALESVESDLDKFSSLIKQNDSLKTYLSNPIISKKDKAEDVGKISEKLGLSATTRGFLGIVAENGRLQEIEGMIGKFSQLMKAKKGLVEATVKTATGLSKKEVSAIEKAVKSTFVKKGQTLQITYEVDDSILGGLQLQVGDKFLDLSVQTQINKLGSTLSHTITQ